jgi:hypothetical protein
MATLKNLTINDTGFIQVPSGTTAQRTGSPANGAVRFNTTKGVEEIYDGVGWKNSRGGIVEATSTGNVHTCIVDNIYKAHVFTGNGTLSVTQGGIVEYLLVGAGGGGGMDMGGGGGGGAVIEGTFQVSPGNYDIIVGRGGFGAPAGGGGYRTDGVGPQPSFHQFTISATSGGNTSAFGVTAPGGGYGGSSYFQYTPNYGYGANGASGGGASGYSDGSGGRQGFGTSGLGFDGGSSAGQYYSGGGGGAGGPGIGGGNQPNGGPGKLSTILGRDIYFGAGGGGGSYSLGTGGNGGLGGGGAGAVGAAAAGANGYNNGMVSAGGSPNSQTNTRGGDAGKNTGSGGGGGSHYNISNQGGEGGDGIVVVRYKVAPAEIVADQEYERLFFVGNNGNLTITGNGTRCVNIFKTGGSSSWDTQAYILQGFTAPCTIEFNKMAAVPSGDNGVSYCMIGWNIDPTTDASYSSIDHASYPFTINNYHMYNNGSGIALGSTWDPSKKFYIVYAANGFTYHYNGSTLLYSANRGTGSTVYLDTSFYSVNNIYGGFSNIRIIKKAWNGTSYT